MAATAESDGIDVGKLWKEIKDWKEHWKLSRFFYVLLLGLAVSVFDSGTDFIFAWSVPEACGQNTPECGKHHFDLASICGIFHYKNIERSAFTFIALPGFFLGFSGLQSLVSASIKKCWRGEVHRCVFFKDFFIFFLGSPMCSRVGWCLRRCSRRFSCCWVTFGSKRSEKLVLSSSPFG